MEKTVPELLNQIIDILNSYEGITIRIQLPEGYFTVDNSISTEVIVIIAVTLVLLVLATYIWIKYCKENDPVVETVEFYPPEGMNSLDVAYVYKGNVNSKDVISLLIILANIFNPLFLYKLLGNILLIIGNCLIE